MPERSMKSAVADDKYLTETRRGVALAMLKLHATGPCNWEEKEYWVGVKEQLVCNNNNIRLIIVPVQEGTANLNVQS